MSARRVFLTIGFAFGAACTAEPDRVVVTPPPPPPVSSIDTVLNRISDTPLSGTPGWTLEQPIVIRLGTSDGLPLVGKPVRFQSSSVRWPEAPVDGIVNTDEMGRASISYRPGLELGTDVVHVTAFSQALDIPIQLTAFPVEEIAGVNDRWCMLANGGKLYCSLMGGQLVYTIAQYPRARPIAANTSLTFHNLRGAGGSWCALALSNDLYCWDERNFGPANSPTADVASPQLVATPVPFVDIVMGHPSQINVTSATTTSGLFCGLDALRHAWCKGKYVGDGTTTFTQNFVAVPGGIAFKQLSLATATACGVDTDGNAWCWADQQKRLGVANSTSMVVVPARVGGNRKYSMVAFVSQGVCGVEEGTQEVYCWGTIYGSLVGQTISTPSSSRFTTEPTPFQGGMKASFLDSGSGKDARVFPAAGVGVLWWGDAYPYAEAFGWSPFVLGGKAMEPVSRGSHHWCARTDGANGLVLCAEMLYPYAAIPMP